MATTTILEKADFAAVAAGPAWTILSPVPASAQLVPDNVRPRRLGRPIAGAKVGLDVHFAWSSYIKVLEEWTRLLEADQAEVDTLWLRGRERVQIPENTDAEREIVDAWSEPFDCVVVGLGNCGACTANTVLSTLDIEKVRSYPTVVVVTTPFESSARCLAEHWGNPALNVLVLPYPLEQQPEEYIRQVARDFYPKLLELLGAL